MFALEHLVYHAENHRGPSEVANKCYLVNVINIHLGIFHGKHNGRNYST